MASRCLRCNERISRDPKAPEWEDIPHFCEPCTEITTAEMHKFEEDCAKGLIPEPPPSRKITDLC